MKLMAAVKVNYLSCKNSQEYFIPINTDWKAYLEYITEYKLIEHLIRIYIQNFLHMYSLVCNVYNEIFCFPEKKYVVQSFFNLYCYNNI